MKSKWIIFAVLAAVAFALYLVFRPGGVTGTGTGSTVNPLAAHAGTTASSELPLFTSLAASISSLFGAAISSGSASQTPGTLANAPAGTAASTAASYDYAIATINNNNYDAGLSPISVPVPTSLSPQSFDYSTITSPVSISAPDYSADTDAYGDILS